MSTATLHVHPACASNRQLIERLQAQTGLLVVINGGKPKLQPHSPTTFHFTTGEVEPFPPATASRRFWPVDPIDPNDGGRAA